jgi:hypothetical protein
MVLELKLPESQERGGQIFCKKHELPLSCNTPITIYTADENFNFETFRCHYAEHKSSMGEKHSICIDRPALVGPASLVVPVENIQSLESVYKVVHTLIL